MLSILFHIVVHIVYPSMYHCSNIAVPISFGPHNIIIQYIYKSVKKNTFMSKRHTTIIHVIGIKYLYYMYTRRAARYLIRLSLKSIIAHRTQAA